MPNQKTDKILSFYAPIQKKDNDQRMVYGYASTEAVDSQGEIVTKKALGAALEDYMKWANVREMHQPSAVGRTKKANLDAKGMYVGIKVVDDNAWKKVKEGVYNGFSIGGRVNQMVDNNITGLTLTEISLVDRPANPEARFDVWKGDDISMKAQKREFTDKERQASADKGHALPDGSFPIENVQDLKNAIHAIGRAKDPAKAKAHIKARAKDLGQEALIPDSWKSDEPEMKKSIYDVQCLASVIQGLSNVEEMVEQDGAMEGNDPLDAAFAEKLNAQIKILGDLLVQRTQREVDELTEEETNEPQAVQMADTKEDIKKDEPVMVTEEVKEEVKIEPTKEPKVEPVVEPKVETPVPPVEKPVESIVEAPTEVKIEEKTVVEPTEAPKPTQTPVETPEVKPVEPVTEVPKVDEKTAAIDSKIISGHMPDENELKYLLQKAEIEVTARNLGVLRHNLATQMVDMMEKKVIATTEQEMKKSELAKEAKKTDIKEELPHQFDEVKLLVKKLEKQITETQVVEGGTTPIAPVDAEAEPDAKAQALTMLQQVVDIIAALNTGNQLTDAQKEMLNNGVNNGKGEVTSVRPVEEPKGEPEVKPLGNVSEMDTSEMQKFEKEISDLKEQIKKLNDTPMPIKAQASYQVVEKAFDGSNGDAKIKLGEAEKKADEVQKLLKLPHDATLEKEAGVLASEIMKLRREVNGQ